MVPLEKLIKIVPAKQAYSLFEQFKKFAFKGNVIDLAVGVIVGTAFGKLVDSLVKNLIMPFLGIILPGNKGYLGWKWSIDGKEVPYGLFLGDVVNFLIVALAMFLFIVKFVGWLVKSTPNPPPLTPDQQLLTEIRDLLRRDARGEAFAVIKISAQASNSVRVTRATYAVIANPAAHDVPPGRAASRAWQSGKGISTIPRLSKCEACPSARLRRPAITESDA